MVSENESLLCFKKQRVAPVNRKSLSIPAAFSLLLTIILFEIAGSVFFHRFFTKPGILAGLWFTCILRLIDFGLIVFFVYLSRKGPEVIGFIPGDGKRGVLHGLVWSLVFGGIVFSLWGALFLLFHINLF